jgi:hypothetical protein
MHLITGSVTVNSILTPVQVTGSITTTQGAGGSDPWNITYYEEPTFIAFVSGTIIGNNKSMISIVNTSSKILRIQEIKIINTRNVNTTGVEATFWFIRIGGHSGGTSVSALPMDTNDILDPGVTVLTNATVASEATIPLFRNVWSTDEWAAASSKQEGQDHALMTMIPIWSYKPKQKPIILRTNEGFSIKHTTNSINGTFDIQVIFTQI